MRIGSDSMSGGPSVDKRALEQKAEVEGRAGERRRRDKGEGSIEVEARRGDRFIVSSP